MPGDSSGAHARADTAVCFALEGTLVTYDRPYAAVVRETLGTEFGTVADAMVETFLCTLEESGPTGDTDPTRVAMTAAADAGGADPAVIDRLLDALLEAETRATTVPPGATSALAGLAADESVAVCVLADDPPAWAREKLAEHGLAASVDAVITTRDVGARKETGVPYDAIRERVDAGEYVMIGPDDAADVEAARAAGFVPIHYEGPDFFGSLDALL